MLLCPECRKEVARLKEGMYCPHCWAELKRFKTKQMDTILISLNDDAPPTSLLNHWMSELSKRLTQETGNPVHFDIHPMQNRNKYMRELAMCSVLLGQAPVNYDIDLAKKALSRVIETEFKAPITLTWVVDSFIAAAFIVIAENAEKKERKSQDHTQEFIEGTEDVWA